MARVISPALVASLGRTNASSTVFSFDQTSFSLGNDEAVVIHQVEFNMQALFPGGTADHAALLILTLDPDPTSPTFTAGVYTSIQDNDWIAQYRAVEDLITSGYAATTPVHTRDFTGLPQGGILTAQDVNFGVVSNNVGLTAGAQVIYSVVRLDDDEIVSLVARRRR